MDFDEIAYYLGLVLVGCIWGITNPFMEQGANSSSEKETEDFGWKSFIKKVLNLKFLLPFLINQSGSGFYYFLLGQTSQKLNFI